MASSNLLTFNDTNFFSEVIESEVPVVVHFTATWTSIAKRTQPIIDSIADEFKGVIKVGNIDIDESPRTPSEYNVRSCPVVLIFKDRQKIGELSAIKIDKHQILRVLQI